MGIKIAIASSDGLVVDTHFGHAERFTIIETAVDGSHAIVDSRDVGAFCGAAGDLDATVGRLADCSYVLASRIGPCGERALAARGITAFAVETSIDAAVKKILTYANRGARGAPGKENNDVV